ncbi:hypothetical protein LZ31DRAFT_257633 [Colletotrichum somersetense]|nr:hypothetical protein LZ31DRAFT_257633 [Colletotrichum somersetense]
MMVVWWWWLGLRKTIGRMEVSCQTPSAVRLDSLPRTVDGRTNRGRGPGQQRDQSCCTGRREGPGPSKLAIPAASLSCVIPDERRGVPPNQPASKQALRIRGQGAAGRVTTGALARKGCLKNRCVVGLFGGRGETSIDSSKGAGERSRKGGGCIGCPVRFGPPSPLCLDNWPGHCMVIIYPALRLFPRALEGCGAVARDIASLACIIIYHVTPDQARPTTRPGKSGEV